MPTLVTVLLLLLSTQTVYAGQKPICAFSPNGSPAEIMCGSIGDMASDKAIEEAYQKSVRTGFAWILQMADHDDPTIPADKIALRDLKRFAKLMPYIHGVTYGQEWNEQCNAEVFARYGLPSTHPRKVEIIYTWLSYQHYLVRQIMNRPVIWITTAVYWDQPVPLYTDVVAIDAYTGDGESTWWSETVLKYAETQTNLPLVVIPRWFMNTGPKQGPGWKLFGQEPTKAMIDSSLSILARDRYIAMWGFLFESRLYADLVGLKDMPVIYNYFLEQVRLSNK